MPAAAAAATAASLEPVTIATDSVCLVASLDHICRLDEVFASELTITSQTETAPR